jgi:hypothetical protein
MPFVASELGNIVSRKFFVPWFPPAGRAEEFEFSWLF